MSEQSPYWTGTVESMGLPTDLQLKTLTAGLNPARISNRNQGGRSLSYLEAWDVKATLIRLFGFGGFSADVTESEIVEITRTERKETGNKTGTYVQIEACAKVTVRLHIKQFDCTYTETAVASQKGRDVGEVVDFAMKTAASDALKRCAIYLGTQFGLSLYDNGSTADVVRVIVAPGQEWPQKSEPTPEQAERLAHSLGGSSSRPIEEGEQG